MSLTVYLLGHKVDCIDVEERPLRQVVERIQMHWNEDTDPQTFAVLDDNGATLAVLMRDSSDPEVCHTLYLNGTVEHHRCKYILDAQGHWLHTEVTIEPDVMLEASYGGYRPGGNGKEGSHEQ